jgi:hypothetical protein
MKTRLQPALVLAALAFGAPAFADSLSITSVTELQSPGGTSISSTAATGFSPGRDKIVLRVVGKTCTFNSSGNPWNAGAGAGCNYSLTVNQSSGELSNPGSNANGCTPADQMIASCR